MDTEVFLLFKNLACVRESLPLAFMPALENAYTDRSLHSHSVFGLSGHIFIS